MTETVLTPEMTDDQYTSQAENLLAQMRLLNEESARLQVTIEDYKGKTRQNLHEAQQILREFQAR